MSSRRADFEEFVAARSPTLIRLAFLLSADYAAAEDLLQTALVRAYVRWGRISSNPEAYIRRALVNEAIDRRRRPSIRREIPVAEVPTDAGESDDYLPVEVRPQLHAALADLPPRQRAAVVLRHWVDLDVAQTAELLGCSLGTVRSQSARGLEKLRAALASDEESERNVR